MAPDWRVLTDKYGIDWMGWQPSVLRKTIEDDFHVAIARVNLSKAMAAAAVATRDEFWKELEHFHFLCQALNNNVPIADEMQELTVGQMMVAVDMATEIRKELKDLGHRPKFSDEVARFVASHALNQGVWYLPPPLDFASDLAAKKRYRCKDCGNEGEVLFDDGLCDVCVERFDTERMGAWRPNNALVAKGRGKNVEFFERNPTREVKATLDRVLKDPNAELKENRTDICVARLLVALRYVGHRRNQLKEQAA